VDGEHAEQLALQQRLGDGGTVESQKRRLGPRTVLVDGAHHQFLARAALARDEHREGLVGDAADSLVHRIRHKDGSVRWIWARGHGVFAPDGSLRFIEGWNLDITPRKQAEERLRISEERWRLILDDAFVAMSADGLIAEWNR
jgi:PAS domain-containing protein